MPWTLVAKTLHPPLLKPISILMNLPFSLNAKERQSPVMSQLNGRPLLRRATSLLEDVTTVAADIKKFLMRCCQNLIALDRTMGGFLTIPVSVLRCCDWKNTASVWLQAGQVFLDLGSYSRIIRQSLV